MAGRIKSIKNSYDTIGNRTRSASTNRATLGVQAGALASSRTSRYVDITHKNQFRKGNNDERIIMCGKGDHIVLDGSIHC